MSSFYKLMIAAILFPLISLAQSNYKPGFAITNKGDTLKGYIEVREWSNNPDNINYKSSLNNSKAQNFTVADISYFELPKIAAYRRFNTSISLDETKIKNIGYVRDTTSRIALVFLKVEQRGNNITLYSYQDDLKTRFYLYENSLNTIAELIYRIHYIPSDLITVYNNVTTVSQNAYKQQLLLSAEKFDTFNNHLKSLIEDANYNVSDMGEIFQIINNINKREDNSLNRGKFKIVAEVGVDFNKITPSGLFPFFNEVAYSSTTPMISVGINFDVKPAVGKLILKIEMAYSSSKYSSVVNEYFNQPDRNSTYAFDQHTIAIIPQIQYNIYNTDPIKFYIDGGLSINVSNYKGNSLYNPELKSTQYNFLDLNGTWYSFPLKAGVTFGKRVNISLTYFPAVSITNNANSPSQHQDYNYSLKIMTIQAGLNYVF